MAETLRSGEGGAISAGWRCGRDSEGARGAVSPCGSSVGAGRRRERTLSEPPSPGGAGGGASGGGIGGGGRKSTGGKSKDMCAVAPRLGGTRSSEAVRRAGVKRTIACTRAK